MPDITRDEVAHLANLARIDLDDAELDHLAPQLSVILESVASISGVAADDIPPTSHALPLTNVFREDVVRAGLTPEQALSGAPARRAAALLRAADPGGGGSEYLDPQTAAELADALAAGETTSRRAHPGPPRPDRRRRRRRARVPARRRRGRARPGGRVRRPPRRRHACSPRSTACRSRSRTCSPPRACRPPAARRSSRAGSRRTTRPWSRGCKAAGLPILGKTNMDEFAMGSSTEHSAYGATHNPWDLDRIPGGSGGGSAAAVAAFEAPLAIGTDTGGSIRQPGAVTGTVGVKPTYGGVSPLRPRRAGQLARPGRPGDPHGARLRAAARGHRRPRPDGLHQHRPAAAGLVAAAREGAAGDLTGLRVGVIKELGGEGYQAGVIDRASRSRVDLLVEAGAEVVEVSCPNFVHALAAYYLILPAEASQQPREVRRDALRPAGLARGRARRERRGGDARDPRRRLRRRGQAPDHPRHLRAVQRLLRRLLRPGAEGAHADLARLRRRPSSKADVLVSPTAPTTAFKLGEKLDDPIAMYLNDLATIPANLAGVPGISVPSGLADEDGLPAGFQILAPALADDRCYRVGAALEAALLAAVGRPAARQGSRLWKEHPA